MPAPPPRSRPYTLYEVSNAPGRRSRLRSLLAGLAVIGLVAAVLLAYLIVGGHLPRQLIDRGGSEPPLLELAPGELPSPPTTAEQKAAPSEAEAPQEKVAFAPINTAYPGLSMFRGNAHRAYYGEGPVPRNPRVLWRFPEGSAMSGSSSEGGESRIWSGTGWTGQPVVLEREGRIRVMFGAYDKAVHFLDGDTGERFLPDLATGDIIKGSVAADPDGYPLLYTGSRDNFFRVIALDRAEPAVLWKLDAASVPRPVWNNDWDSSPVIIGDYLFEGGENSYFFIIKLNRSFTEEGKVAVDPQVVLAYPGYNDDLFKAIGDRQVSIESSPAVHLDPLRGDRVYFTNSGGRVVGLDIGVLGLSHAGYRVAGQAPQVEGHAFPPVPPSPADPSFPLVFDFWTGDDVDASVVVDEEGMLYVAAELERMLPRAKEVGQLMKLDPYREGHPLVWSVADPAQGGKGGIWATPALHGELLYVPTHTGRLLAVDRKDGAIVWEKPFTYHAWGSPAVVDDTLIVGDTEGWLHAYDLRQPREDPPELWKVQVPGGGALESTPAVWHGRIYVGSRNGYFYAFGDE